MKFRKKLQSNYEGYLLQSYGKSLLSIKEVKGLYKKLKRVPHKITAFIEPDGIKEVYKFDKFHYFIIDENDEVYVLDY